MTEIQQTNSTDIAEDENNRVRPADIEADMREMERRKRVESIMQSRSFREELDRIVDSYGRESAAELMPPLSGMVVLPDARVIKSFNGVLPINDIRGFESLGYAKGEKILRCKLAATFRLLDLQGYTQCLGAQVTVRLNDDQELFLVNPAGLLSDEVTASSLNKVDMQGNIVQHGTTNFGINSHHHALHSVVHAARPDVRCVIYINCSPVVAVSGLMVGLLPLTQDAVVLGEVSLYKYTGTLHEPEEREKLIQCLGRISKVLLLSNHGALCCGETIEEAFYAAYHIVQACETQLKMLPIGIENLSLIPEEERKAIYDYSRRPPEIYETRANQVVDINKKCSRTQASKWCVGGAEFEAFMRMLDNAGFRSGYIYRNPLVKFEVPKRRNNVEVPLAVSSLGYLLEEEDLYRQGTLKKSDMRKDGDCTRWLNSPNVYQKVVEVLETGTPDPKKITKWVADRTPKQLTARSIEKPMQFVPPGTNPKEFKKLQQLIKDNRRADKISAGPQSQILEGVTWDEVNRIKDAANSGAFDPVVLMGAASKGIVQRGYQNDATVYKTPYAKNPFESVTDDELEDYKKTVERKRHDDYTDVSEPDGSSSVQISASQPFDEAVPEVSEPQVNRTAPKPSQPAQSSAEPQNDHTLIPRRLYVELEDRIAAMMTRNPKFDDLRRLDCRTATTSEPDATDLDCSGISSDNEYITFIAQSTSPFRTVSHFGFKSPAKNPSPTHYHVPTDCTKYVGVITELSIEELFATKKYLDYPDDLVPLMQRRKKLARSIIRGRVERRRRSPPKPFAIINGCREYLVHGSGQQPHQSYIKMLEKYFVETPNISRKEDEKRKKFEETVHALVTKMIDMAEDEPEKLKTISEEASVDIRDDTSDTGSTADTHEVEPDFITMIEVEPIDTNSVITPVPITDKAVYDIDALKPPGKLEITSLVENFMKQLAESRFSNESPNLDYQPGEVISTPQSHNRSLLSRSNREARRAEFIELWEDHLDFVSIQERLAHEANTSPYKDQTINDDFNTSIFDSMDNIDDTIEDLISSTSAESSDSYEPIERKIIDKINLHRLDHEDDIFTKIKQTIYERNNSKFEQAATINELNLTTPANKSKFQTSTPTNSNASQPNFKPAGSTAIPKLIDSDIKAVALKKTTKKRAVKQSFEQKMKTTNGNTTASSVTSDDEQTNPSRTQRKTRNFIAENIKMVSARGNRAPATSSPDHCKTPLNGSSKSKTAVKSFMKSSTKTGSSLLWLSVSAASPNSSNTALNDCTGKAQDLSKQYSEFSSFPSNGLSVTTANRVQKEYLRTDDSADVSLQNDVIGAAERHCPIDLSSNTNDTITLVQKCTEHIASLRLNEIHLDMDEILQIHNDNIAEHAVERERREVELAEDWRSYNRIAFSLSGEED